MNQQKLFAALSSIIFLVVMYPLISLFAMSSVSEIEITYRSDHEDSLSVYYSIGFSAHFSERRSVMAPMTSTIEKTVVKLPLDDRLARNLRLDPGEREGEVAIHQLVLRSNFADPIILDASDIYHGFVPNEAISVFELKNDHVLIKVDGDDPQLLIREPVSFSNLLISVGLPIVLTMAFYLIASTFGKTSFPAVYDLWHQRSSANINYAALDGIRGIAVLLVLLEHTVGAFRGAGIAGVWIFFVLSGFLLAIPFVKRPEVALSTSYMSEYLLRRLKRIIPMYYFFIVMVFLVRGKVESDTWRHLLFLQGDGHLWSIPQEMLFYLFLPFIMSGVYLLFRGNLVRTIAGLFALMVLSNVYLGKSILSIYGQNTAMPAFVGIFICGIMFSYIYHGLVYPKQDQIIRPVVKIGLSILGIVLLGGYVLLGTDTLFNSYALEVSDYRGWFAFGAGCLILIALITSGTLFGNFLSWFPLRAVGLVGFSFYLLHPTVIGISREMQDYYLGFRFSTGIQLIIVLVVTYIFSAFTYSYIERPFLKRVSKTA